MTDLRRSLVPRAWTLVVMLAVAASFGCWEQMDGGEWFPQMKKQIAVQAFEQVDWDHQEQGFTPPDGTVPIGGSALPDLAAMSLVEQDAVPNPVSASLDSLKNGEQLFVRFCSPCHGPLGMGDGKVAAPAPWAPNNKGPFQAILPINGPMSLAKAYSDGHIYTTISMGRGRMPSYNRIPAMERWDIVNYIREINGQGVRQ
jgi:mono/diheme cytochrome c family protein